MTPFVKKFLERCGSVTENMSEDDKLLCESIDYQSEELEEVDFEESEVIELTGDEE